MLRVRDLSVDYLGDTADTHAVRGVSFELSRGELLGLAGESGCGKSTLAYAVARLLRAPAVVTGGSVVFEDAEGPVDVLSLGSEKLRLFRWSRISMVFQSAMNALNPVRSLQRQLEDVFTAHHPRMTKVERVRRCRELVETVGIDPGRLPAYPHELSGGMRQRAMIAMALALQPDVIIMDEPTTALDVVVQRDILLEINRLRAELGFSVLFITHDISLLLQISDRVAIMYAGKIVEVGTAEHIRDHPGHPYTAGLLGSFPDLHGPRRDMRGIPGSPPDLSQPLRGCQFRERCPYAFAACADVEPPLVQVGATRAACLLHDRDVNPGGAPPAELRGAFPAPAGGTEEGSA
ncbi:ABC transporter ATP-binding protein [Streptomyces sp. CA-111067]|uniref:ABC transporter ATP-binding protein n=1 Tax=Streptomyces sp. CA-111067 TaxID=3240046 RepID=UPI003D995FDD